MRLHVFSLSNVTKLLSSHFIALLIAANKPFTTEGPLCSASSCLCCLPTLDALLPWLCPLTLTPLCPPPPQSSLAPLPCPSLPRPPSLPPPSQSALASLVPPPSPLLPCPSLPRPPRLCSVFPFSFVCAKVASCCAKV